MKFKLELTSRLQCSLKIHAVFIERSSQLNFMGIALIRESIIIKKTIVKNPFIDTKIFVQKLETRQWINFIERLQNSGIRASCYTVYTTILDINYQTSSNFPPSNPKSKLLPKIG